MTELEWKRKELELLKSEIRAKGRLTTVQATRYTQEVCTLEEEIRELEEAENE